ncbi:GrpB family protein [Undibacterium crateris]|uniref:GrpB family protein n=1 Tax=Undibacterium crateris TaxID=2528175 RepID=UPI00138A1FCD|nr:GrpB family protein [Undibacterium crateris]NDI84369.1 GrpB family protein [Undibacterium crateris]
MHLLSPSEYQPIAAQVVEEVAREVTRLIPGCRVEHVGSSAIPGVVSKGDIDVCVVVPAQQHQSVVTALELAGYAVKRDTLRTPELCMLLSPRANVDVALHVVAEGSRFEFFMRFRDALLASPTLVKQYNEVKQNACGMSPEEYRNAKSAFIASVLRTA